MVHAAGLWVAVAARAVEASLECCLGQGVPEGLRDRHHVQPFAIGRTGLPGGLGNQRGSDPGVAVAPRDHGIPG